MEKLTTLSIYRSYKERFKQTDLDELSKELSKLVNVSIDITSVDTEDGEYLRVTLN